MSELLIARQPIYDREQRPIGYEILFRGGPAPNAAITDPDQATSQVILDAFMEIGLESLVGSKLAFINCTRPFLTAEHPLHLPVGQVVLEVLEDVEPDAALVQGLRSLGARGYQIALDDYCHDESHATLLEVADIVKLDIIGPRRPRLLEDVKVLQSHGVQLLAEKVETPEDYDMCHTLGFDFFQGYFLCKPRVFRGHRSPGNRLAVMRLLADLQDPDLDPIELERVIANDVTLSYRLLRYVNSAFFGLRKKIESIQRGIVYLGFDNIRTWATVLAMAGIEGKPSDLVHIALLRARMCELLTRPEMPSKADQSFTVGMFSVLDALLDAPMIEALEPLPLAPEVEQALLTRTGPAGETLEAVLAYERRDWEAVEDSQFAPDALRDAYLQAVSWAREVAAELAPGNNA